MTSRLIVCIFSFATVAYSQQIWFEDNFDRIEIGPQWNPATGQWRMTDGLAAIKTKEYDQLLASFFYTYDTSPYSLEVRLRGVRSGIYFSLDDTATKKLSHMVRFDEKNILTGHFNGGGEYTATNVFDSPRLPTEWTLLRIDVDPKRRRYEVFVDGKSVGIDTLLRFSSGFIGLQASDGTSEFDWIRVSSGSKQTTPVIPKLGDIVGFNHVSYVSVEGDKLTLYDPERRSLQTVDLSGRLLQSRPFDRHPGSSTKAIIGERTYHISGRRILIKDERDAVVDSITERLVAPAAILSDYAIARNADPQLYVADAGANAILTFDSNGRLLKSFTASSVDGFIAPRGVDFYGSTQLVIADYNRLLIVDRTLEDVAPGVHSAAPDRVTISWKRTTMIAPTVRYSRDGVQWITKTGTTDRTTDVSIVFLGDLDPLTRYSFFIEPALQTIPFSQSRSREFRFSTSPSDPSMMAYTRLPILCMAYRTINYRDVYPKESFPEVPDGRTITDDEIEYLKSGVRFNEEFYFRNSSCRLALDFDFFVVDDTLWLSEVGDSDPYWLSPNERVTRDYEKAVAHFGKRPEEYVGLVVPYAWVNHPPRRTSALRDPSKSDSVNIRQAYGGGTNGVPAPWKYGKTTGYTGNPFQDRFSRQDWLITHEFHHQIDALMEASGYPEYYHADQPWKMPGRFGEDFDFNAHIIRNAGVDWWMNLKFGTLEQTRDADRDGVPDDDPTLPFDEKRLNGDPDNPDTDHDGLNDLDEVMAGTEKGSTLNHRNADGDALEDMADAEPLYPIDPIIKRYDDQLSYFATLDGRNLRAEIRMGWLPDSLIIAVRPEVNQEPVLDVNVLFQIDANNDGWFHGFDNWQIRIRSTKDSIGVIDYYLRDCSSWTDPPKDRKDILDVKELDLRRLVTEKEAGVLVRIPRNDAYGLDLHNGKKMSIRFGIQTTDDRWVWHELFERNYMMQVELR